MKKHKKIEFIYFPDVKVWEVYGHTFEDVRDAAAFAGFVDELNKSEKFLDCEDFLEKDLECADPWSIPSTYLGSWERITEYTNCEDGDFFGIGQAIFQRNENDMFETYQEELKIKKEEEEEKRREEKEIMEIDGDYWK